MNTVIADDAFDGCDPSALIIYAPEGSTAQAYAESHAIVWMKLE